ncbi:protein unc-50 homolog, partial [Eurytemora carolleeae]|uniref:protein unc-50 homolog n=1 Tax=Eurytemora carolleeae TaxID=1294199 RepID=UPI000C7718DB
NYLYFVYLQYLRRIFHFRQMDFEFALWQMLYLFYKPQQVYRNFQYRKVNNKQFARDDPAFLVLLAAWLIISSAGFSLSLFIILILSFIEKEWFVSTWFGNTLWLIALGYYIYITFLGYSSLKILQRTHLFLYPFTILFVLYITTLCFNWNLSRSLMWFYKNRVL